MAETIREIRPTRSMLEPLAVPTYALIAICFLATGILSDVLGFTIAPDCWAVFWAVPLLAMSAMLLRRVGHGRSATAVEGITLIYGQGLAFMLLLFPLSAISRPFADVRLDSLDQALGFDWSAYARLLMPVQESLQLLYLSLDWQPLLLVLVLTLAGQNRRMWQLVFASTLALAISAAIFPFFPAIGAAEFHGFHLGNISRLRFGEIIAMLKGGHRLITVGLFTGFISFPSYHAASATLFAWAGWSLRPLRWALIVLNILMCFAAIIFGGHYLVDILAGIAVAGGCIEISGRVFNCVQRRSSNTSLECYIPDSFHSKGE